MIIPLSVLDLVPRPHGISSREAFANSVSLAQEAERLGYRRYWIAEHHNTDGFISAATVLLIGHLAAQTSSIRVGSGGIMLPNHSPLAIAEQFLTLESLYPGRIDLGLGRAPGTDQLTAFALRRSRELLAADDFPQQIELLRAYAGELELTPGHPLGRVRAAPGDVPLPPLWILGSSNFGAELAAHLGLPYSFAYHFSPQAAPQALHAYHSRFRPSRDQKEPLAMLGVAVVCAPTREEADYLAGTHDLMWLRIRGGQRGLLPTAEEAAAHQYSDEERELVRQSRGMLVWGDPAEVRQQLLELSERFGVHELIVTSHIADHEARLRSYRLLAEAFAS